MKPDHLVKILAEHGIASRRASERMIREGLVTVDGQVVSDPGLIVDIRAQKVLVDKLPLPDRPDPTYLVMHKPRGVINSKNDPEGRATVYDLITDKTSGLETVGRLDYGSEGVLIVTNDGEMAYRLTHPGYGVTKTYLTKVSGTPDKRKLSQLAKGVILDDGPTSAARVELVSSAGPSSWVLITIHEGRNRIVRRLMDAVGHRVLKLKRVGFGGITLRGLEPGQCRSLSSGELTHLRRLIKEPGPPVLKVSYEVRRGVAEALRLPTPDRELEETQRARDGEGRPYRKKGWARPKARKGGKPGAKFKKQRLSAGPRGTKSKNGGRGRK